MITIWFLLLGVGMSDIHSRYPTEAFCESALEELAPIYPHRSMRCIGIEMAEEAANVRS